MGKNRVKRYVPEEMGNLRSRDLGRKYMDQIYYSFAVVLRRGRRGGLTMSRNWRLEISKKFLRW